ncbi:hypothetical protein F4819DRAFT_386974 [Hypoxylon fuscum]|nr:hypothetical protein F4819DRAFT_386974 [Hypoxylon fuscum]
MEVLGAVAATGQLIGTAVNILDLIAQLRDFLRYAPDRYQGWHTELYVLGETIAYIRDNSKLQTCQVSRIITGMAPKIQSLTDLCKRYSPDPDHKFLSRLNRAFSARGVEARIMQNFDSLEHDKTTLILSISTIKYSHQTNQDLDEKMQGAWDTSRSASSGFLKQEEEDRWKFAPQSTPETRLVPFQPAHFSANMPGPNMPATNMPATNMPATRQKSTFKKMKLKGNNSICGDTTGTGVDMEEYEAEGDGRVDGSHTERIGLRWAPSSRQSQGNANVNPSTQAHQDVNTSMPRNGVPQSPRSGGQAAPSRPSASETCEKSDVVDTEKPETGDNMEWDP